jgi:hypothetical protein
MDRHSEERSGVTYVSGSDLMSDLRQVSWWARQDLNLGPTDYESAALTAELQARNRINIADLRYRQNLAIS